MRAMAPYNVTLRYQVKRYGITVYASQDDMVRRFGAV